jgi:hypothetical protein
VEADGEEKAPEGAEAPAVKRETFSEMSRLATVSGSPSVFTTTFFVEPGPAVGVSFTLAVTTTLLPGSNLLEDGQTRTTGDMMVEIPVGAAVIASSPPADEITVPDVHRGASSYSVIWRDCEWVVDVPTSVRIELRGESQILPTQLRATYQDAVTGLVRSDWVWMSIGMPARPGRLSDPMEPTP